MAERPRVPECLARWVGRDIAGPAGVLHVAAAAQNDAGPYATLRVGEGAPRAVSDGIVLSGARARADAIVTTGRILRDEPELVHGSISAPDVTAELDDWRRRLGFERPPWIAVLTGRGELPAGHPALAAAERLVLFTGVEGAARLEADPATPTHADIVVSPEPSARGLIEHLQSIRRAESIVIEAGASTSRGLYDEPATIDELWLSVCRSPVAEADRVGPFVDPATIETALGPPIFEETHEDTGLTWSTRVHRRPRSDSQ